MARYFLRRILLALPALWLVSTLVFLMIHTRGRAVGALSFVKLR